MQQFIELLAVISSAIYGTLLAIRHGMDFVGVFSVAFVVAFGGGTLRDLFLDRHPLFWIRNDHYAIIVFAIAFAASAMPKVPKHTERFLNIPDAFGLGLFSIAGAAAALGENTSWFIASMLGAVTGTFGGVMGDIVCNRIPSLFRPATPLCATCSFVGSWVYILLAHYSVPDRIAAPTAIVFIIVFRLAAVRYDWKLPGPKPDDPEPENAA